jgi:hypothetical protein
MISGAKFYDDRERYYIQTNNPTEVILSKIKGSEFLESCGPSAMVNCIAPMGYPVEITCPGRYKPQPEEVAMDFFNDPRNNQKLYAIRTGVANFPGNRIPQYYPLAAKEVFNVKAVFKWGDPSDAIAPLMVGQSVQMCLRNPGHFLAFVAYDDETQEFIYNDSWPARVGGNGFNVRMPLQAARDELQSYMIIYGG